MLKNVKSGWRVDFRLGSHRLQKTLPTKRLAEAFEATKKTEYLEAKFIPRSQKDTTLFSEFVDDFFNLHAQVNMVQPEKGIYYVLEDFKEYFGTKRLAEIKQRDIEAWKANLVSQVKPATVNRHLNTLKSIFNKAIEWEKLKSSPAKKVGSFWDRGMNLASRYSVFFVASNASASRLVGRVF